MSKAKYSLVFDRKKTLDDKKQNSKNQAPIELYAYIDRRTKYFSTGIYIYSTEWDKNRRQVNKSHPNATKLNIRLSRIRAEIEDYELSIMNERGNFTYNELKDYVLGGKNTRNNFIDWLKNEIEDDNTVKPNTKGYRLNMVNKLIDAVGDNIPNSRVDYAILKAFDRHMASEGLTESTRSKLHNQLRKFITIANNENIIKYNPYKSFKVKRPTYDMKKCLWFADLNRLWELKYPDDSGMELARLKFLFSCYTGLRISDNTNLSWSDLRDGKLFIKMQKTVRPVVIPVNILGERARIPIKRMASKKIL